MESGVVGGGGSDENLSSGLPSSVVTEWSSGVSRRYQYLLDKSTPHVLRRWIGFSLVAVIYMIRVYFIQGFYIISYGLGIYILNLLIAFLSPQVDPEIQELSDGPTLPTRGSDEFRPFVRRLPEFKFWYVILSFFSFSLSRIFVFPIFLNFLGFFLSIVKRSLVDWLD
ncbi:Retrieval of early ER protein Rer1 [Macleaya cordata]|uniref:Retrieval of early ER protein Rer1 n=1 Tax=Macleaya cordata TaxID=56857 RepID=A0A200QZJ3_MACCD|nr:Retrieval of early ER protein Rer1 [Macleaya cordata]